MADELALVGGLGHTERLVDMGDGSFAKAVILRNAIRATEVAHRAGITSADTLALPGTLTLSAITEAGSTLANVAYHVLVAAGNRWGTTGPGTDPGAITPTASQAIRCAFAAVTGADYYDIFLSTAVAPLWVGRITETQRAAGGFIISTVGTTTAGGGAPAGAVDLGIVGTGVASTAAPFAQNSAMTPAAITPVNCVGYSNVLIMFKVTCTDLRLAPTFVSRVMLQSTLSTGDWFSANQAAQAPIGANASNPLEFYQNLAVNGAAGVVVTLSQFSSNISSIDVWVARI